MCDTDGLDASYPQGTLAVQQHTDTFKLRQQKSIIFIFIRMPAAHLGETEQIMSKMKRDKKDIDLMIWRKNAIKKKTATLIFNLKTRQLTFHIWT